MASISIDIPGPNEDPTNAPASPAPIVTNPYDAVGTRGLPPPPDAPPVNPYDAVGTRAPTPGGNLEAFGQAAAHSAISTVTPMAGMTTGAAVGALVPPPLDLATVPLGAGVGFLAGEYASHKANDALGLKDVDQTPAATRAYSVGGDALGGVMGFAGGTAALAQTGINGAVPFVQKILDFAKASPARFLATEGSGAIGSAIGGFGSEQVRPGDIPARIGGEVLGGIFSPTRLAALGYDFVASRAQNALSAFSEAAQQTMAGKQLASMFDAAAARTGSPDADAMADILKAPALQGANGVTIPMTSAQVADIPALSKLEQWLSLNSTTFGANVQTKFNNAMTGIKGLIQQLQGTGDPAALAAAGDAQTTYMRTLVQGRVNAAVQQAITAASQITQDSPQARSQLGQTAVELVGNALADSRAAETGMWSHVDQEVPMRADHFLDAVDAVRNGIRDPETGVLTQQPDILPTEPLPDLVGAEAGRLRGLSGIGDAADPALEDEAGLLGETATGDTVAAPANGASNVNPTTSGQLILLRSRLLDKARQASSGDNPDLNAARIYGKLAESVLDDLNTGLDVTGNLNFDKARTFSRELNDAFSRTFAGKASATNGMGASRLPPEAYLRQALGAGGEVGDVRMQQLQDATDFMGKQGLGGPLTDANTQAMTDAQERLVRLAANDSISTAGANEGRVNPVSLGNFMRNNASILDRFPEVRTNLQNAIDTEQGARALESSLSDNLQDVNRNAFAKLGNLDSPTDAVTKALTGPNPSTDFDNLVNVTKTAPMNVAGAPTAAQAQSGLKSAALQSAVLRASAADGTPDFNKLDVLLNQPLAPGLPSLTQKLRDANLMTTDEAGRLTQLIAMGQKVQNSANKVTTIAPPSEDAISSVSHAVAGAVGAKAGGWLAHLILGSTSLVAQSAGARMARNIFAKMGGQTQTDVLLQAADDPQFMSLLLQQAKAGQTQEQGIVAARQMHAYLLNGGFINTGNQKQQP